MRNVLFVMSLGVTNMFTLGCPSISMSADSQYEQKSFGAAMGEALSNGLNDTLKQMNENKQKKYEMQQLRNDNAYAELNSKLDSLTKEYNAKQRQINNTVYERDSQLCKLNRNSAEYKNVDNRYQRELDLQCQELRTISSKMDNARKNYDYITRRK